MTTMTLTIRKEDAYLTDYIEENNIDISELTINEFLELLEDAQDLYDLRKAKAESDGTYFTMDEVAKELGIAL